MFQDQLNTTMGMLLFLLFPVIAYFILWFYSIASARKLQDELFERFPQESRHFGEKMSLFSSSWSVNKRFGLAILSNDNLKRLADKDEQLSYLYRKNVLLLKLMIAGPFIIFPVWAFLLWKIFAK